MLAILFGLTKSYDIASGLPSRWIQFNVQVHPTRKRRGFCARIAI